jgi:C-22 sterol desaturase
LIRVTIEEHRCHPSNTEISLIVKHYLAEMTPGMFNASGVQLELSQTWVSFSISQSPLHNVIPETFVGWSNWQYILTFVLGVILYDQGKRGVTPDAMAIVS